MQFNMTDLKSQLLSAFDTRFSGAPDFITSAPGRINLIGEHTDYNDGFVLPMAIDCGTMVAARKRNDGEIRVYAADLNHADSFSIDAPITPSEQAGWSNYVRGVAHALRTDGLAPVGADIAIAGNVPQGAGLSSSASLEVACGLMFAAMSDRPDFDRSRLALAGQRAEHEFAGCNCGIMDQLISACGVAGHALLIDCRSLEIAPVPMPSDWAVMIVHSGQERGLVDGEYNARRAQCEAAAEHFGANALRDVSLEQLCAAQADIDPIVFKRARHVVTENARTCCAADALRSGNLVALGQLMAQSHVSMRDDFAITTPAIDALVALLQTAIGSQGGARMTGGGFGGAVVAVMPSELSGQVAQHMRQSYVAPDGAPPLIIVARPAEGARIL